MTQRVDMRKIIFVCTGNTCRSPMAEGLFKKYLYEKSIDDIDVSSAGISAFAGDSVSENSVIAAKEYGVDISSHRSKPINHYLFTNNTFFVCMTDSHKQFLSKFVDERKIYVLNVSDPYGGDLSVYKKCAAEIQSKFDDLFDTFCLDLSIKKITADLIKPIAKIEKECFSDPWSENSLSEELINETARFFAAIHNNEVIGYIGANNICGEVYITNIAVKKKFRCKGIASELLKTLIDISKKEDAEFITLEVREGNMSAIKLYDLFGFKRVGLRKSFYTDPKEDAVLMTKYLN